MFPLTKHKIPKKHTLRSTAILGTLGFSPNPQATVKGQTYLQIKFQAYLFPNVLIAVSFTHCIPFIFSLQNSHTKILLIHLRICIWHRQVVRIGSASLQKMVELGFAVKINITLIRYIWVIHKLQERKVDDPTV